MSAGKGDAPRPVNMTAYLTHYDEIFRKHLCQKWEKWPHDPEPFESEDHDNDSEIYQENIE